MTEKTKKKGWPGLKSLLLVLAIAIIGIAIVHGSGYMGVSIEGVSSDVLDQVAEALHGNGTVKPAPTQRKPKRAPVAPRRISEECDSVEDLEEIIQQQQQTIARLEGKLEGLGEISERSTNIHLDTDPVIGRFPVCRDGTGHITGKCLNNTWYYHDGIRLLRVPLDMEDVWPSVNECRLDIPDMNGRHLKRLGRQFKKTYQRGVRLACYN